MIGRYAVAPFIRLAARRSGERLGVVTCDVRRLAGRLAHHGQPRRSRPGGQGVPVGELRVLVDQQPGGGEVLGDPGRELLRQTLELRRIDRSSSAPVISSGRSGPSYRSWSLVRGAWSGPLRRSAGVGPGRPAGDDLPLALGLPFRRLAVEAPPGGRGLAPQRRGFLPWGAAATLLGHGPSLRRPGATAIARASARAAAGQPERLDGLRKQVGVHSRHTGLALDQRLERQPAEEHGVRSHREGREHVEPAADPAVDVHLGGTLDRRDHAGQAPRCSLPGRAGGHRGWTPRRRRRAWTQRRASSAAARP